MNISIEAKKKRITRREKTYPTMYGTEMPSAVKKSAKVSCKKIYRFHDWLRDFFSSTSMHGLAYVVESKASLFERAVWLGVFATGLVVSAYLSLILYVKWEQSPVITSVGSLAFPVEDAAFPAVSVCNSNKVSKKKFANYLKDISGEADSAALKSLFRGLTSFYRRSEEETAKLAKTSARYNLSMDNFIEAMKSIAPPCSEMVRYCTWQGVMINCSDSFRMRPSDEGYCCVFNGASLAQRLRSSNVNTSHFIPAGTAGGVSMGLSILLDANLEDYLVPTSYFNGFKVVVHESFEFPEAANRGFVVEPGTETFAGVRLSMIQNSELVHKNIRFSARNCYFQSENELTHFVNYSTTDCLVDCRIKKMLAVCGCRPWFWLSIGNGTICDVTKYQCIIDVDMDIKKKPEFCGCEASCEQSRYDLEISQASFPGYIVDPVEPVVTKFFMDLNYTRKNLAMVHVFYKDRTAILYVRDIRYGWEDFVASIGGLLGLGVGFSVISAVEIIYFLFFRWWLFSGR